MKIIGAMIMPLLDKGFLKTENSLQTLRSEKMRSFAPGFLFIVFLVFFPQTLPAWNGHHEESLYDKKNRSVAVDIESHSGTPPVLEFILRDPDKIVQSVSFDFESDHRWDLVIKDIENEVLFRGVPYRAEGVYRMTVLLNTLYGTFQREFLLSFTEFMWGRDNYRFANDGRYENFTDFVSERLIEWAEERFGNLDQDQEILLLSVMYNIYVGSIGRCYGFTGGQTFYIDNPGRIPAPFETIYFLSEMDEQVIRDMDYVQNDIVFSSLMAGRINVTDPQDSAGLREELRIVKDSINRGEPVILGYISSKMHHSMVVYGYFENTFRDKVTLLTANNWERNQNNNTFSEDAENIVIELSENIPHLTWYDLTKKRYRYPERIFVVVREQNYSFDPAEFQSFLREIEDEIVRKDKTVVMVEKTEIAVLSDTEGKRRGFRKPRYFNELEDVSFKKVDYNYVFEIPRDGEYNLAIGKRRYNKELRQHKRVNVYAIIPDHGSLRTEAFRDIRLDDTSEKVFIINRDGIRLREE